MAVIWPDGSVTGSVRVETPAPTPAEPEPEKQSDTLTEEASDAIRSRK